MTLEKVLKTYVEVLANICVMLQGDAHGLDGWTAGRDCLHLCFGLSQAGGAGSMDAGLCGDPVGMVKF